MAEYSRIAKGSFTSTGFAQVVNLPFLPGTVSMVNYTAAATPANHGIPWATWDASMGQGFAVANLFNATPVLTTGVVTTGGIQNFSAGQLLQYGPLMAISGVTKASAAVVTTVAAHGLATGAVVMLQGLVEVAGTSGMQQISGIPFTVTVLSATTFSIPWNTNQSNYTAITGSPAGAYVKQVLYPYLYQPGVTVISSITLGTTTTVVTTTAHNYVLGQEVAFRITPAWGTNQLNSLPNNLVPGSPNYGVVTTIVSPTSVIVNINSSAYTAFNSNQPYVSYPGEQFPQMVAVGTYSNSGWPISAGSVLYPPPVINGFNTIGGPATQGAFVNNTSMGFIIGAGATTNDASSVLVGASGNVIYWQAEAHDFTSP